jgi:hypothetical protein
MDNGSARRRTVNTAWRSSGQKPAILVTTVVGLAIFLVAVLLSPETKGKVLVADLTVA